MRFQEKAEHGGVGGQRAQKFTDKGLPADQYAYNDAFFV